MNQLNKDYCQIRATVIKDGVTPTANTNRCYSFFFSLFPKNQPNQIFPQKSDSGHFWVFIDP